MERGIELSDKYIKRTEKGKGKAKKEFKKEMVVLGRRISPIVDVALALMVIADIKDKEKKKEVKK